MTDYKWTGPNKRAEDMHPDLKWLAENVSEWTRSDCNMIAKVDGAVQWVRGSGVPSDTYNGNPCFIEPQWLQARKDLGLIMTDAEEELPAKEWAGSITDSEEEAEIVRRLADDESIRTTIGTLRSKYHVVIKSAQIDVYDILHAFGVTNHADAHAIKKLLKAGQRGYKDANQDRQEAIGSIKRAMELEDEV